MEDFEIRGDTMFGYTEAPRIARRMAAGQNTGIFTGLRFTIQAPFRESDPRPAEIRDIIELAGGRFVEPVDGGDHQQQQVPPSGLETRGAPHPFLSFSADEDESAGDPFDLPLDAPLLICKPHMFADLAEEDARQATAELATRTGMRPISLSWVMDSVSFGRILDWRRSCFRLS